MSKIHQCNDGSQDITGRATPREYVPCSDSGGVVGQTPPPSAKALDDVGPSPTNEKDKNTEFAGVIIKHPLTNEIWMRVNSKSNPMTQISAAADTAIAEVASLQKLINSKIK